MNKQNYGKHVKVQQNGVTLLEILVSIVIGSILVLATTSLFIQFNSLGKTQKETSLMMDEANGAFLQLDHDIRMAGAGLCVNPFANNAKHLSQRLHFPFDGSKNTPKISEFGNKTNNPTANGKKWIVDNHFRSWYIPDPTKSDEPEAAKPGVVEDSKVAGIASGKQLKRGSDILLSIYASPEMVRICNSSGHSCGEVKKDKASRFSKLTLASKLSTVTTKPAWLMISDCDDTEVLFYDTATLDTELDQLPPPPSVEYKGAFSKSFYKNGSNAWVAPLHARIYFVTENGTLYRKDLLESDVDAEPLAHHVEKLSVEWLQNGKWIKTSDRTDWAENLPARVSLIMSNGEVFSRIIGSRN